MALSKITASKIVDAVSNDAWLRRRVNSWTGKRSGPKFRHGQRAVDGSDRSQLERV